MRAFLIVLFQIGFEILLHLIDRIVPLGVASRIFRTFECGGFIASFLRCWANYTRVSFGGTKTKHEGADGIEQPAIA